MPTEPDHKDQELAERVKRLKHDLADQDRSMHNAKEWGERARERAQREHNAETPRKDRDG